MKNIHYRGFDMYILDHSTYVAMFQQMQQFDCRNDSMSNYLKQSAYCNHIEYEENTTLVLKDGRLLGYFTLKMDTIDLDIEGVEPLRTLEIKRLAVDKRFQQTGNGVIITHYIDTLTKQANIRYITTNALSEYSEWYMNRGFSLLVEEDIENDSPTLYMYKDLYDEEAVDRYYEE
ncbi:GNAT family N-acetyltransferase [Bacillus bombysepticus]|nr:GNAT family N-acetyltransferase [Bacillus bombysepticus]